MTLRTNLSLLFLLGAVTAAGHTAAEPIPADTSRAQTRGTDIPVRKSGEISYLPQVYGAVKAKMELSTTDGEYRFNVRNSRIGVKGFVSPSMRYAVQVDFNNEGKISILDSYVTYFRKNFEFTLGQQQYKFSTDLDRGPSSNMFANRSFIAKYLTSYYGSTLAGDQAEEYVKTIGSRDIGALGRYSFRAGIPMRVTVGVFNGSGSNNPEWSKSVNLSTRLDIGKREGLGGAASFYTGRTPLDVHVVETDGVKKEEDFTQKIRMWGCELHYVGDRFLIEAEVAQRILFDKEKDVITAAHIQGYYQFGLPRNGFAEHIAPIARWDTGHGVDFLNSQTKLHDRFNANRMTIGVNFGLSPKLLKSELRLNYEKYFLGHHKPSDFAANKLLQDKFTIEVVASF